MDDLSTIRSEALDAVQAAADLGALEAARVALPVRSRRVWRALVSAAVPPEEAERAERRRMRGTRTESGEGEGGDRDAGDGDTGEAPLSPPSSTPSSASPLDQEWLLQLWEPPTEDSGAPPLPREGQVVWMTSLTPRPRWRGDPLALSRPQLSGGRATAWGLWGGQHPPLAFGCPARRAVDLSGLSSLPRGADFDFEGVLVAARNVLKILA